jgi:pimeloyl-ACP methyl ester carboxylesterase
VRASAASIHFVWSSRHDPPAVSYTRTWCPSGEINYLRLRSGARLRYLTVGSGPPLVLLHTVRTQLDHFQLIVPKLAAAYTVYALDLPGMGWSDITPRATYSETALRAVAAEFVRALGLTDLTLAGESMGATLALTASIELGDGVRRVVAVNPYDYTGGVARANLVGSLFVNAARLPAVGSLVTRMENKPVLGMVLRGGLYDGSKLPAGYLAELRRAGRRPGYSRVAQEVYRNVPSMIDARALYPRVAAPVTLIYGEHDWSQGPERSANEELLRPVQSAVLLRTGHFATLERPDGVAEIILGVGGSDT